METCGCCEEVGTGFKRFSLKSLDPDAPSLVWFVCAECERQTAEDIASLAAPRSQSIH